MLTNQIRFDDGAAYERYMGKWSQLAGETFLDWLAPKPGLRCLDVGCGNGAFTEILVERRAPVSVQGIDRSEEQLAFARTRPVSRVANCHAAGDFLRSRRSQGRCRNGTSGLPGWHRTRGTRVTLVALQLSFIAQRVTP